MRSTVYIVGEGWYLASNLQYCIDDLNIWADYEIEEHGTAFSLVLSVAAQLWK
jgi:hypothetical protein